MKKESWYLLLTILLWSATPAVAKLALSELDNFQLLFYTSIIGSISLFLIMLFQGKTKLLKEYSGKDYIKMFFMGVLGVFLYYVFLYGSFNNAPAGQANIVNYLWPIFVIIFSILILKEKFNWKTILAVIISFLGALIVITHGSLTNFSGEYSFGYLLAGMGAVCYGLFSVLGKKLRYDKFASMFVYYVSATILIIIYMFIFSEIVVPNSITTIISILLLGIFMNSLAFVFWFKALEKGHTHKTANAIYVIPFIALIWTYFINSEPISIVSVLGLILIVGGIFIQVKNKV